MPIHTAIWKVAQQPEPLAESMLAKEQLLEEMIVAAPRLLSEDWMLIGRQEETGFGGRIDLLAIAPDGSLVLIELKRDRTPRDVVAQALDYASWVEKLRPEEIAAIYGRFAKGQSLAADFQKRFGQLLDEEALNHTHQIIIVASALDDSTERIIGYLSDRDIAINVLCFQVFSTGNDQLLSRSWLIDPTTASGTILPPLSGIREPWNGEYYCSFGTSDGGRSWDDAVKYGFISAGGGSWYSKTLNLLNPGDRVWVKDPAYGFIGVGRVTGLRQSALEFKVKTPEGKISILDAPTEGKYKENANDPEKSEYFVPVHWLDTLPLMKAFSEIGLFGIQHSVCRPTTPKWRYTVDRLKTVFTKFNQDEGE
jgi:hypothetical protein